MTALISEAPLAPLIARLRTGETSPTSHLERLRARVEAVDPQIRALLDEPDRWQRLEAATRALEATHLASHDRPALFGVPVGVKDIFHVDGFPTRAGSQLPPDVLAGPEAETVRRLREAGAVLLGKTVTTEFAYFAPGPTRNPHDPAHTPGGSSSGSAAAVAAGLVPLALGSQTIGSVNRPAAFCGVVGVKPSFGRISVAGVVPVAPSVDTVGFFTQDVAGAQLAAGVLYDRWRGAVAPPLRRIVAVDGPYLDQCGSTARTAFEAHLSALEGAGYDIERTAVFPAIDQVNAQHTRLVAAETALSHSTWYPAHGDRYAPATATLIEEGQAVEVGALAAARAGRGEHRRAVETQLTDHDAAIVVSPAAPGPAPEGIETTGDPVMNLPWSYTGLPTVTVPAGRTDAGLPLAMQVTGRFGADEWVLSYAHEVEDVLAADR